MAVTQHRPLENDQTWPMLRLHGAPTQRCHGRQFVHRADMSRPDKWRSRSVDLSFPVDISIPATNPVPTIPEIVGRPFDDLLEDSLTQALAGASGLSAPGAGVAAPIDGSPLDSTSGVTTPLPGVDGITAIPPGHIAGHPSSLATATTDAVATSPGDTPVSVGTTNTAPNTTGAGTLSGSLAGSLAGTVAGTVAAAIAAAAGAASLKDPAAGETTGSTASVVQDPTDVRPDTEPTGSRLEGAAAGTDTSHRSSSGGDGRHGTSDAGYTGGDTLGSFATDKVRYLRDLAPAREIQRLAIDLDDARVAVRFADGAATVDVMSDPSSRLDSGWVTNVEKTLRQLDRPVELTTPGERSPDRGDREDTDSRRQDRPHHEQPQPSIDDERVRRWQDATRSLMTTPNTRN
jgi:hypothetical protein